MAKDNTDFLRFNAYSIKDLITRKLSQDSKFTDQIYEGSNLAILIDLVSYMYQCLLYQLNNAASESMFADTQIYENISRLCKFIGYHPKGFVPASMNVYIDNLAIEKSGIPTPVIYPCSGIDTGMVDSKGNKIYFSTVFSDSNVSGNTAISTNQYTNLHLINGRWKMYSTVFTASGTEYETFVLDNLVSDSEAEKYIANNQIAVVVKSNEKYTRWNYDSNELFIQAFNQNDSSVEPAFSRLYNNTDRVYSVYLNSDKTYEIKFGNGVVGAKLNPGDLIYIMYLDSNGPDGQIDPVNVDLSKAKIEHSPEYFGISEDLYYGMFEIEDKNESNISNIPELNIILDSDSVSTAKKEETPTQIRENAPNWFKTGNRLITKEDYEFFFKANTGALYDGVVDAKCMNNWDYMKDFYSWLYEIGTSPNMYAERGSSPYVYLNKSRISQNGYQYVDSADANNLYMWLKYANSVDMEKMKQSINAVIQPIKTMTTELYPLLPVDVYFDLSFTPEKLYYDNLISGQETVDTGYSYLEITMTDSSIYSNVTIKNKVASILGQFFDPTNCKLGQVLKYNDILEQIYDINGVSRIRTVFCPDESDPIRKEYMTRACDGLSFASYSHTNLIDVGDDLQLNNTSRQLKPFQFPVLSPAFKTNMLDKIKVIKKSMNTTNPVRF